MEYKKSKDNKKWFSVKEKTPRSNEIVELKAVITFNARYQPYSHKQEWKALGGDLEKMKVVSWRKITED